MRPRYIGFAAVQLISTLSSAPPAEAQMLAADSIRACYVPASGTIYRIKAHNAPANCVAAGHIEFSWTIGRGSGGVTANGPGGGNGNTTDHGSLAGLQNDDHPQYLLGDGVRASTNGFAVTGLPGKGSIPMSGTGIRMMWYPAKAAFRAGEAYQTDWEDANIGYASAVLGWRSSAPGVAAVAVGLDSKASGIGSFAAAGGVATNTKSVALGPDAQATGHSSTAVGYVTRSSGDYSVAIGIGAKASADRAMSFGGSSNASAEYAVAVGDRAVASGYSAIALGTVARATSSYAVALGVSEASGPYSVSMGQYASTNGKRGSFVFGDASNSTGVKNTAENQFVVRAQRIWLGTNNSVTATTGRFLETSTGAYLSAGGAWVSSSDSTRKHLWQPVDGEAVLAKLAALPIRTWSYTEEEPSVRHMGPTAQDFRNAFELGDTDRAIASVDADGVALVAAQALEQRTRAMIEELAQVRQHLAAEVSVLRAELAALRVALEATQR